ncbi:hypothetical protein [Paraflavitalea pollutisoli]|uniref:hypothetical protein n=1 Tax=Paraflavitalea pollutisoli TaxID=3034143 RepID=UPI0023ECABDF|nr:hypothetical protein [Paraflavitalea sp. H1-2-19X]
MIPGYTYKTSWGGHCKILMLDDKEVFLQAVDDKNELIYAKYKTQIYARTDTESFTNNSSLIATTGLTKQEECIHRPDLPLRLNCFKESFWSVNKFQTLDDFKIFLGRQLVDYEKFDDLHADKVVIIPHGQQSAGKTPVLLENTCGVFDGLELMFNCFNIQYQYVNPAKPYFSRFRLAKSGREEKRLTGFGLYRLGIKGNIPSFYLGGQMSLGELESDKSLIVS